MKRQIRFGVRKENEDEFYHFICSTINKLEESRINYRNQGYDVIPYSKTFASYAMNYFFEYKEVFGFNERFLVNPPYGIGIYSILFEYSKIDNTFYFEIIE